MKSYTAVIERDAETGLYISYVPRFRCAMFVLMCHRLPTRAR